MEYEIKVIELPAEEFAKELKRLLGDDWEESGTIMSNVVANTIYYSQVLVKIEL